MVQNIAEGFLFFFHAFEMWMLMLDTRLDTPDPEKPSEAAAAGFWLYYMNGEFWLGGEATRKRQKRKRAMWDDILLAARSESSGE